MINFKEKLTEIEGFVFDVDGVFTDSTLTILPTGEVLRNYNVKDGQAIVLAVSKGYKIGIISGGGGDLLELRMNELGINDLYLRSKNKLADLKLFSAKTNIPCSNLLYVGDDFPDIPPMRACGISVAPNDGAVEVLSTATYVSKYQGGKGVIRDVIEQVLRSRSDWYSVDEVVEPY